MEIHTGHAGNLFCSLHFEAVFLAVSKCDSMHFPEVLQRPEEAGSGILPSAEHHQSFFTFHIEKNFYIIMCLTAQWNWDKTS